MLTGLGARIVLTTEYYWEAGSGDVRKVFEFPRDDIQPISGPPHILASRLWRRKLSLLVFLSGIPKSSMKSR